MTSEIQIKFDRWQMRSEIKSARKGIRKARVFLRKLGLFWARKSGLKQLGTKTSIDRKCMSNNGH